MAIPEKVQKIPMETDVPYEDPDTGRSLIRTPFSSAVIRKITRQSLISFPADREPVRYGLTQKSIALLSIAAGLFLRRLAADVGSESEDGRVTRRSIVRVLLRIPRYRFSVTRLRTEEVVPLLVEATGFSKRIALSEVERPLRFPVEFVAPYPPGDPPALDDREASRREAANVEAAIRAVVVAHHAYRQRVPDCLRPGSYLTPIR
jgi:hypothetical protein